MKRIKEWHSNLGRQLTDTWFLECLAIVLSWLAFGVIVGLLASYNAKPLFTWHGFSLNTWVSIFSTVFKTSLLFAVSECLGQWKYILFTRSKRRVMDFEACDDASRGPKGSLELLWRMRFQLAVQGE